MAKCIINIYDADGHTDVTFEGSTVAEALAMRAEYLFETVGATSDGKGEARTEGDIGVAPAPTTSFLNKLKGGE